MPSNPLACVMIRGLELDQRAGVFSFVSRKRSLSVLLRTLLILLHLRYSSVYPNHVRYYELSCTKKETVLLDMAT